MAVTGSTRHILLVEDEPAIADALRFSLEGAGFGVTALARGDQAARAALADVDLVVLDVMLPGLSGVEVCRRIRERSGVPVIMLTARGAEDDRVRGLDAGADDYVTKPFSTRELISRVHAQLRRRESYDAGRQTEVRAGNLRLDLLERMAFVDGQRISLTETELRLLHYLADRLDRVCTREELTQHLWQAGSLNDARTCDTHIKNLRRKIERDPVHPRRLLSVRGAGYLLTDGGRP